MLEFSLVYVQGRSVANDDAIRDVNHAETILFAFFRSYLETFVPLVLLRGFISALGFREISNSHPWPIFKAAANWEQ